VLAALRGRSALPCFACAITRSPPCA
jgi:hypothetical protein